MGIDLIFLADESGSVGDAEFVLMQRFIADIIDDSKIGKDETRAAVRTFEDASHLRFSLKDYNQDLVTKALTMKRNSGGTETAQALRDVMNYDYVESAGMRLASKKMLVVLTDGRSNNKAATIAAASEIHNDVRNVQVIAIGVGGGADRTELEAIATSDEMVFELDDFNVFDDVKDLISSTVCNAPITGGDTEGIINIEVSSGIAVGEFDQIVPGQTILQLTMLGRTQIRIKSSKRLEVYTSYTHDRPSSAIFDYSYNMTRTNQDIVFSIKSGSEKFYMTLYNYDQSGAEVEVEILSSNTEADDFEIPTPVRCGDNALCNGGQCKCNAGYEGDPYRSCTFDSCETIACGFHQKCVVDDLNAAFCECDDEYELFDGQCHHNLCPRGDIIVSQNHLGYAVGELSSPNYGNDTYPANFDCNYTISAPKMDPESFFEFVIQSPFDLEASPNCVADKLEIFDTVNADLVTMDRKSKNTAVFCGAACDAEGGWVGRVNGNSMSLAFRTDKNVESTGWKIIWIARPREDKRCNNF